MQDVEKRVVETTLGDVWFWGSKAAFSGDSTVILAIHGAFADQVGRFFDLETVLPDIAVVSCCLPGHGCPELVSCSVGVFASAYAEAARTVFRRRRLLICGESVGGLVALAMDVPGAKVLALDPPIRTAENSSMVSLIRKQLLIYPQFEGFIWSILGIAAERTEERDYRPLLSRASWIMIGEKGVVGEAERKLMLGSPHIRLMVIPDVGHVIPGNAPTQFIEVVRGMLNDEGPKAPVRARLP